MRRVVTVAMMVGSLVHSARVLDAQAGAGTSSLGACSLLTKELVTQHTPYDTQAFKQVMMMPPREEAVGKAGSACSYGAVHLQIDPFPMSVIEGQRQADARRGKPWAAVTGVGDVAYFRDNHGRFGELVAQVGAHVVTIQMGVPHDRTTESIKPNAVALAQALVPKLR
jgi:hypothetical protein